MKRVAPIFGLVGVALVARPALADSNGKVGRILSVQINAEGSDELSNYKGALEVWEKKSGPKHGKVQKYVWGGSNCTNRDLSEEQVQVLVMGLASHLKVEPKYKPGQLSGSRCLVAFKLKRGGGDK